MRAPERRKHDLQNGPRGSGDLVFNRKPTTVTAVGHALRRIDELRRPASEPHVPLVTGPRNQRCRQGQGCLIDRDPEPCPASARDSRQPEAARLARMREFGIVAARSAPRKVCRVARYLCTRDLPRAGWLQRSRHDEFDDVVR